MVIGSAILILHLEAVGHLSSVGLNLSVEGNPIQLKTSKMLARIVATNCTKNVLAYQRLGMVALGQQVRLFLLNSQVLQRSMNALIILTKAFLS